MTRGVLKQLLDKGLKLKLAGFGFRPTREHGGYIRPFEGGFDNVDFGIVDYDPLCRFTLPFTVRLDAVEDVSNSCGVTTPDSFHKTLTLGFTLETLAGLPSSDARSVTTEEEVQRAIADIIPIIKEQALPLLERCHTIAGADDVVNGECKLIKRTSSCNQKMVSLILAKLNKRPDFDHLVAKYQEEVSKLVPLEQRKFNNLMAYFKEHPEL